MWAVSARAAGFRTGNSPEVRCHRLLGQWRGYGHVALVTDVEHDQKIQIQEATTTAIAISTTSAVGSTRPIPVWGTVTYIYPD